MPYFRPVRIAAVIPETADACSLVLDTTFDYRPGQYLTVRTPAGPRCYSLSSAPGIDDRPTVTVKRVPGGRVSNWICDHVRAGDTLDMAGPAGTFTPDSLDDDLLFLAAGSGITPIMGIVKALRSDPVLVYANRDAESIIFGARLDGMLPVIHWLDSERGIPTADSLKELLLPYLQREAFVCGPEAFVAVAEKALQSAGVPASRIRVERFEANQSNASRPDADRFDADRFDANRLDANRLDANRLDADRLDADRLDGDREGRSERQTGQAERHAEGQNGQAERHAGQEDRPTGPADRPTAVAAVAIDGQTHVLPWAAGKRLLDVIIDAGLNPPYSCRQGQCGACAVRLVSGEVDLVNNEILEEEDFAEGYILACQAIPVTDSVSVTYY